MYLWKSMRPGLNSGMGKKKWKIGKWYKIKGELEMCSNGFHASERIIDSMGYVGMENLAKVAVRGEHVDHLDKQCWSEMQIVKAWKWEKKDSVSLSIYAANLVLENFEKVFPDDKRPRHAIQVARKWLKNLTEENVSAARSAARSAASAAWSAARVWSAESAAKSAESAAWSAESADKINKKINAWMKKRTKTMEQVR